MKSQPVYYFLLLIAIASCREAKMHGDSMDPTIKDSEVVAVDYSAYESSLPQRWDVVLFNSKTDSGTWCHRVVGLPGETIVITDSGAIEINGKIQALPKHISGIKYMTGVPGHAGMIEYPYKIPPESYFLLGDNSYGADDSRFNGPIHRADILGKVEGK